MSLAFASLVALVPALADGRTVSAVLGAAGIALTVLALSLGERAAIAWSSGTLAAACALWVADTPNAAIYVPLLALPLFLQSECAHLALDLRYVDAVEAKVLARRAAAIGAAVVLGAIVGAAALAASAIALSPRLWVTAAGALATVAVLELARRLTRGI
jgi:hypothetical protein